MEWFVKNGIEVWSAVEGQQRFDNHVDKLLNYIRYWQASGESIKTSVRTKTRMGQLTEEGHFTGGSIPYGYKLENLGRVNKKNKAVLDLVVDEDAAQIVRLIFHKYVYDGYGTQRLCRYLSELGITKYNGRNFPNTSLNRILKNPIYIGIVHNGEAQSEPIPELQIIDNEVFDRAQRMMVERTTHHGTTPLNTRGKSLLVGNVFCGHCGNRLTLTTNGKHRVLVDGVKVWEPKYRYICHYNYRHPGECDGQSGYGMKKLDEIVDKVISYQLSQIQASSAGDMIAQQHEKAVELAQARYNMAEKQLSDKAKELADYQAETIKTNRPEECQILPLLPPAGSLGWHHDPWRIL